MTELTDAEHTTIYVINIVTSTLSIFGEFYILYSYYVNSGTRTFAMKLVASLIVSNFIYTLSDIAEIWSDKVSAICKLEGVLSGIGVISSQIWLLAISYISYK